MGEPLAVRPIDDRWRCWRSRLRLSCSDRHPARVTWNVDQLLTQWTTATEFSVFLRDDATSEQRGAIEAAIDQSGVAEAREYVSKAEALSRFRSQFADLASLTSDLERQPVSRLARGSRARRRRAERTS